MSRTAPQPDPSILPRPVRWAGMLCALAGALALRLALLGAAGAFPALPQDLTAPLLPAIWALGLLLTVPRWKAVDLLWLLPALLAAALPAPLRAFGFVLAAAAPPVSRQADGRRLARLGLTAALLSLLVWTPAFQFLLEALASTADGILGLVAGHPLRLGPGALGLPLLLFFLADGFLAPRQGARRLARLLPALPALVWLVAWTVWLRVHPEPPASLGLGLPLGLASLLFLAARPALPRSAPRETEPAPFSAGRLGLPLLAGLALWAFGLAATAPGHAPVDGLRVAFREAGDWSWETGRQGQRPGPRIGGLLETLKAWGATVEILPDSALLARAADFDLVFAVHPSGAAAPALRDGLFRFMERGGSLVVVGEHTDVGGILEGVNSLIEPSGIRLRDDSAIPALRGWNWAGAQRALLSPATRSLKRSDDFGVSIGGSLAVSWPAEPLVVGTTAFSDAGDAANPRGKLGDNRWGWAERYGDLPLAAQQRVGRGRLVVIGDTSGLMSLSSYRVWPFHLELAAALGAPSAWNGRGPLLVLALLLAAAALSTDRAGGSLRGLGFAWLGAAALLAGRLESRPPAPVHPERIAWLDAAWLPNWMHDSNLDWAATSLVESIFNAGLLPLERFDAEAPPPAGSRFLLLSGPARELPADEIERLADWVEGGGHLVVAADFRRGAPLEGLLARFGLRLLDVPLGTAPEAVDGLGRPLGFEFYEAWPFACDGEIDTLASCWGYPLIVESRLGAGRLSAVGDERFFSKAFIEGPSARGGKPLNTARRFLADLGRPKARPVRDAAEDAWLREHGAELHRPVVPAPERQAPTFTASRARAWGLLGIRPAYPPGDPPASGAASPLPGGGTPEARRLAAQRQQAARLQAARLRQERLRAGTGVQGPAVPPTKPGGTP